MLFRKRDAEPRSRRELFTSFPHAFAGAAAVSGGAAGAVAGLLAGPLTAVIGGVLGTAIGAFAGVTFERDERISGFHERYLDDEIGVTRGSLGVPVEAQERNRTSLTDAQRADGFRVDEPIAT